MTLAEAIADALHHSHVRLTTAVPGHGATQTYEAWRRGGASAPPFSFHEEVAVGMAHGAAVLGHRSAVLLKAHGFLKAANAIADSLAAGTTAGLLLVVFHDPTGAHSDSVLEIEGTARDLGLPTHRPEAADRLSALPRAVRRSETQGLPHLVILSADAVTEQAPSGPDALSPPTVDYERDVARHVCCPLFAEYQHGVFEARLDGRDPDTVPRPALPQVPDELPDAHRAVANQYEPLLQALSDRPRAVTTGDTTVGTLFALPPVEAVDLCTYMGGSLPLALGAQAVGKEPAWAVTGDFGFVAAGHLGLLEAQQRSLPLRVLLLDNGRAHATGGQSVPRDAVDTVLAGYTDHVVSLDDPTEPAACREALDEAAGRDDLVIVRARYRE
ncbi:MAG: thiamine pyrophosphate-dependent enzyme [Salinibacter sp.]|uniref:thiamine pyrophosphate-dependent enzyme n=1 Tax=Salinibacter sp. TaxID=2065818 RepID=UPI0035D4BF53